jgi:hypothetical protein
MRKNYEYHFRMVLAAVAQKKPPENLNREAWILILPYRVFLSFDLVISSGLAKELSNQPFQTFTFFLTPSRLLQQTRLAFSKLCRQKLLNNNRIYLLIIWIITSIRSSSLEQPHGNGYLTSLWSWGRSGLAMVKIKLPLFSPLRNIGR